MRMPVNPGFQGDARELEHRDEVLRSRVVRFGANLAQCLLEREDEIDGEAGLVGHLCIGA